MTREQAIDEAVRRVMIKPNAKRPFQRLRGIVSRAEAAEAFRAGIPNRSKYPNYTYDWGAGREISTYNGDLGSGSVAEVALQTFNGGKNRQVEAIRAEYRRIAG